VKNQFELKMEGAVAYLELSHGKANEMGSDQLDAFESLCDLIEGGGVQVLITWSKRTSSRGTPIFIAGANVTERKGWSKEQVMAHVRRQRDVLARVRKLPLFHIAVINGVSLGWGTEFTITCDYRIACEGSKFGLPETGLGIIPGAGGTGELWSQIGVPQALRLGMTGERIGPEEALRIGLVQEVAGTVDDGLRRACEIAKLVSRNSPTAVAAFKRGVLAAIGSEGGTRQEIEALAYEHCLETGEANIGRENFKAILRGESVEWGPLQEFEP